MRSCALGPVLLIALGVLALLAETGHVNVLHLLHWYTRWWPLLLIGAGLIALAEARTGRSSCGARIAFIVCCLAFVVSYHGSFGFYAHGHPIGAEDLARFLAGK